jgi:alpha-1,6-mannosyltransferase
VAETVHEGVGQLARSADPDDYAEAIEALFVRDIEALGAAARVHTVERFSWNRVFEDLCMTYGEVSGRPEFVQSGDQATAH